MAGREEGREGGREGGGREGGREGGSINCLKCVGRCQTNLLAGRGIVQWPSAEDGG